jgi:hypothetical protein
LKWSWGGFVVAVLVPVVATMDVTPAEARLVSVATVAGSRAIAAQMSTTIPSRDAPRSSAEPRRTFPFPLGCARGLSRADPVPLPSGTRLSVRTLVGSSEPVGAIGTGSVRVGSMRRVVSAAIPMANAPALSGRSAGSVDNASRTV